MAGVDLVMDGVAIMAGVILVMDMVMAGDTQDGDMVMDGVIIPVGVIQDGVIIQGIILHIIQVITRDPLTENDMLIILEG